MAAHMDMPPSHGRYLLDQDQDSRTRVRPVLGEQSRQDGGVVIDDCVGDQPGALVADFDLDIGL